MVILKVTIAEVREGRNVIRHIVATLSVRVESGLKGLVVIWVVFLLELGFWCHLG